MAGECRNCGKSELQDLGLIGQIAPFFLKRVLGAEIGLPHSTNPAKQFVRATAARILGPLTRLTTPYVFVEMQVCLNCSFVQTKLPFHDDDIMRLYLDYRSPSYNRERMRFEPSYAAIASHVGYNEVEVRARQRGLEDFLRRTIREEEITTILDYGGSDGRFMPSIPASKSVFEISDINPVPGVVRIHSEQELGKYSLVLLAHVTEHVPHPLRLVRKLRSYVEPGRYVYIETPQEISDEERENLQKGTLRMNINIHEHINSYCVPAVSSLLESAGFTVVAIERVPTDIGWTQANIIRALGRKDG